MANLQVRPLLPADTEPVPHAQCYLVNAVIQVGHQHGCRLRKEAPVMLSAYGFQYSTERRASNEGCK